MNLKTTFALIVLLGAGVGAWYWFTHMRVLPAAATSPTLAFLEQSLTADKLTRIEVTRGKDTRFVLEKTGAEWNLPGKWPRRQQELDQWIATLTSLRSRFAPTPMTNNTDLKEFGLKDNPLTIKVKIDGVDHTIQVGEEPSETNRFTRATYARVDDKLEIIRLGPGLLASLDRPIDYFQLRELFPFERVAKDEDAKDKIEQLDAAAATIETATEKFTIAKKEKEWTLKAASKKVGKDWQPACSEDRLEPGRLKSVLAAFPDLWAEKFVDMKDKTLDDFGLKEPDYTLTVTRAGGTPIKLLIGKVSKTNTRLLSKPPPPNPFGQPPPKMPTEVTEEYRYGMLEGNNQVFEIKADKVRDIAVSFETLRDPHLAHFNTDDVKRLEMRHGEQQLVLVKRKDNDQVKWRFEKPGTEDAETKQVEDVLVKLASLQARDKEILDNVDLKTVGLDKPQAEIKITLEEGKDDNKKTRTVTFQIGTKEKEKDKLYVKVDAWPRVNQVGGDLLKLVERPALAYRNRRVLDLAAADLSKIEIRREGETFTFEKKDGVWKLAAPVQAEVDAGKIGELTNELGKLEGVEFVSDRPKQEEIDKSYGLGKPKLTATLYRDDPKKKPLTLILGSKREGKTDYYARVDQGPVFTLKKDMHDDLDRPSLTYRTLQVWKLDPDAITEITVQGAKPEYRVKKEGLGWKITQPFAAPASPFQIDEMADGLAQLKGERFVAHQTKDLGTYGLDKPALTIRLAMNDGKPHALEIGKIVDKDSKSRYARQAGTEAVFVLSDKTFTAFNRDALDLLDKTLLTLNPRAIQRVRYLGTAPFTLESMKDQWQVVAPPAAAFNVDEDAANGALVVWIGLRADKFVAYGPKIDWAKYGLEKPAVSITVTMNADKAEKDKKPAEHVLELGNVADGGRYARIDKKDGVVLLDAKTVESVARTHLDFVDPRVLKFDLDGVTTIHRQMQNADVTLAKREEDWQITKPAVRAGDNLTVNDLLEKTFRLRAKRVAAYPAKDLQPFGLDKPAAVVTLTLDASKHVIKVGNLTKDAARKETDERYAVIDDQPTVVVLSAELSRHLVAPVLYFADRNLASFSGVDSAELTRGQRKVVFTHPEASWQMIAPIKSDAEDAALDDLIRGLQRLRADEIVAEKGADLKKYGLDQPILQWRFKAGDAEKLNLLVGAAENDKPGARRYAKLGGGDQVFLLSSKTTAKVMDEYRSRKPWGALDAAQIDELFVVSPDKAFTLKKKDGQWSVAGEPDAMIKGPIMTDALDAIASLKVLRYVADTKGDLQLYGLTKPAWSVTVQTPTGKRTLLLGRYTENSKRFYAAVAGSDVVFVIDEPDGLRIARPLSAYVEMEKKK